MCGICGKLLFDAEGRVSERLIRDMATMLAHRGPDDEGVHIEGQIGLGHRRLSIIDVSGGHQPLSNEDDTLWIVFNGEIYNHVDLRHELEAAGHRFRTHTDTESILHAYEEYGAECVERLRGMFAFAIWDVRERTLFAARDRFGIKPFYYRLDQEGVSFASETKALLVEPGVTTTLDPLAVYDFFTLFAFGQDTLYREIRRLRPAHWMRIRDGQVEVQRYWRPVLDEDVARGSADENLERLEHLLATVIREFMMSEVPQGVFLSGGVDSSLITILMSKLAEEPVRTFSMAFEGSGAFDESRYARQVAESCGTDHRVYNCSPDAISLLPKVLWHLEEPLGDAPALPLYTLSHAARDEVTVVHCGDGGDEAFGGYTRYYWDRHAARYNAVPRFVREKALAPLFRLGQFLPGIVKELCRRGEKFTRFSGASEGVRYLNWLAKTTDDVKDSLFTTDFLELVSDHRSSDVYERLFEEGASLGLGPLQRMQYCDLHNWIPDGLILKADKITMSAGLEGRFPFLDERLVSFGLSLPDDQKIAGNVLKHPLRRLLSKYMPREFVFRGKRGFAVPVEDWFRHSLKDRLDEVISESATAPDGILSSAALRQLADRMHAGDPRPWSPLWSVYVFQQWRQVFSNPVQVCREHLRQARER